MRSCKFQLRKRAESAVRVFPRGRIRKTFGANGVRSAVPKIKKTILLGKFDYKTHPDFVQVDLKLSSKKIIKTYHLGTSANVSRIKQALISKEIIEIQGNHIEFLDPLYKSWLKKHYFKLN